MISANSNFPRPSVTTSQRQSGYFFFWGAVYWKKKMWEEICPDGKSTVSSLFLPRHAVSRPDLMADKESDRVTRKKWRPSAWALARKRRQIRSYFQQIFLMLEWIWILSLPCGLHFFHKNSITRTQENSWNKIEYFSNRILFRFLGSCWIEFL